MNAHEIQMCVADVLRDDALENVDSIVGMLNHEIDSSWRAARGRDFSADEVREALSRLMIAGFVTPFAERATAVQCGPIPIEQVGRTVAWDAVWFHLELAGNAAVNQWWESEGKSKYPL